MNEGTQTTITACIWDEEMEIPRPDVSNLITEDDTPVDNQFSEKQMRLLTESIHASWRPGFPFVAMANVGVFVALNRPPVVPDVLVTTQVEPLQDLLDKEHRAYYSWQYEGKVPDVVIEIVSNTKGGELGPKLRNYQQIGVTWYAVFDPMHCLSETTLSVFKLERDQPPLAQGAVFASIGLGLLLWEGEFEGVHSTWLRWQDAGGTLLLTGQERAAVEASRAAVLAAKLRELGVDPDSLG
jgi:Uma2 family endonuclease